MPDDGKAFIAVKPSTFHENAILTNVGILFDLLSDTVDQINDVFSVEVTLEFYFGNFPKIFFSDDLRYRAIDHR